MLAKTNQAVADRARADDGGELGAAQARVEAELAEAKRGLGMD